MATTVRTRFAPSPTGYLHIGGLRTAAYAYALAKHSQGEFWLRIEDTDQKREVAGATQKIYDVLGQFMHWDGVVIQSERAKQGVYKQAADQLLQSGHAFYCQCQPRNAKTDGYSEILRDPCRDQNLTSGAVKLRIPDGETISYYDFVLKKDVSWDSDKVPDTILLKSDGVLPTYHLAQAVDDHFMQISHVVRAVEWVTSTPIHVLVHRYLKYPLPEIGHPSDILDPDGGKLSKRKGNVAVEDFLAKGYLPEALLNFVILLGWAPKDNRELFTLADFVQAFDMTGFQKSNPMFNLTKLEWFNGHYIREKSDKELVTLVKPFSNYAETEHFAKLVTLVKDRLVRLTDFDNLVKFIFEAPVIDSDLSASVKPEHLQLAHTIFSSHNVTQQVVDEILIPEVKNQGWKIGDFFMSLRIAICGTKFTPPLTEVMLILGKHETLKRLTTIPI